MSSGEVVVNLDGSSAVLYSGREFRLSGEVRLSSGMATVVVGNNGGGKTVLLGSLARMLGDVPFGPVKTVRSTGAFPKLSVGMVRQEPIENFLSRILADEVALQIFGIVEASDGERKELVSRVLALPHLDARTLELHISELSSGESLLSAVGASLVGKPRVVLLDEPLARIDAGAQDKLAEFIWGVDPECAVVCAAHDLPSVARTFGGEPAPGKSKRILDIYRVENRQTEIHVSLFASNLREVRKSTTPKRTVSQGAGFVIVKGDIHFYARSSGGEIERFPDLTITAGLNTVRGPNGSGKSLLLRFLAGRLPFYTMRPRFKKPAIWVEGAYEVPGLTGNLETIADAGRSVYMPSDPGYWLTEPTVQDELWLYNELSTPLLNLLAERGLMLTESLDHLSYGQQKIVSLLSLPEELDIVCLDEPYEGLDESARSEIAAIVESRIDSGHWKCVVIASCH